MLSKLRVQEFRNYRHAEVEFRPGVTLLVGANAQGKTNLLEAICLLATGRLLRGQRDSDGIRHGALQARVAGELAEHQTHIDIQLEHRGRKRILLNGASLPRASDLLGRLPTVLFWNSDLEIVRGDASARRAFLDAELAQMYPAYLRHLTVYKRALEQRNALLRRSQEHDVSGDQFDLWEQELEEHGADLRKYRRTFVTGLNEHGTSLHQSLANGEELALQYQEHDEGNFARAREACLRRGTSTVGPHRDDLRVVVEGREARFFGSQGQQRTAAISLKLATLRLGRQVYAVRPVVLLDDILSELDESRRTQLLRWVSQEDCQTVLTCTEADQAGENIARLATLLRVSAGTVERP